MAFATEIVAAEPARVTGYRRGAWRGNDFPPMRSTVPIIARNGTLAVRPTLTAGRLAGDPVTSSTSSLARSIAAGKDLCLKTGNAISVEGLFPLGQFFDRQLIAVMSFAQAECTATHRNHYRSFRPSTPSPSRTQGWKEIYEVNGGLFGRPRAAHGEPVATNVNDHVFTKFSENTYKIGG